MFCMFMYIYVLSIFSLMLIRKHIFLCLLSLEFVVISLLMMMINYLLMFSMGYYLMVLVMVLFVCEGVLGLSVMVSLVRCFGNDYLNSMSMW